MINEVYFLTSNKKKAEDFNQFGITVKEFKEEIPEVLSKDVETVVLYKAYDVKMNNIIVEDTSLEVEGADFFGTQIKHVYDEVKENQDFNDKKATWKVSICMKKDDYFYISTGELEGKLKYPAIETGYHFDRIFSVPTKNGYQQFELISKEEKMLIGPRYQAIQKLVMALKNQDLSSLKKIHKDDVLNWNGEYQIETKDLKVKNNKI